MDYEDVSGFFDNHHIGTKVHLTYAYGPKPIVGQIFCTERNSWSPNNAFTHNAGNPATIINLIKEEYNEGCFRIKEMILYMHHPIKYESYCKKTREVIVKDSYLLRTDGFRATFWIAGDIEANKKEYGYLYAGL